MQVVEIADAPTTRYKTTVIEYEPAAEKMANLLAAAIPGAELEEAKTTRGIDVEIMVGRSFETRRLVNITPIPIPSPGEVPAVCKR